MHASCSYFINTIHFLHILLFKLVNNCYWRFVLFVLFFNKLNTVTFKLRYDSESGTFTVPPGGDGYYYFSTYLVVNHLEYGAFDIVINGERLCTAYTEQQVTYQFDPGQAACSGAVYVTEGTTVFLRIFFERKVIVYINKFFLMIFCFSD